MQNKGTILIADDEAVFRSSTADLLQREGYGVTQAPDSQAVAELLPQHEFDLLIADIKMPGNSKLELIHSTAQSHESLPVILVTGYPDLSTAVASVRLPVVAYLIKPLDLADLLHNTDIAVRQAQASRRLGRLRHRIERWHEGLTEEAGLTDAGRTPGPETTESFVILTMRHIVESLLDLQHVATSASHPGAPTRVCHLMECPRLTMARNAMRQAIDTLERTKHAFKSRELATLRHDLEQIVASLDS